MSQDVSQFLLDSFFVWVQFICSFRRVLLWILSLLLFSVHARFCPSLSDDMKPVTLLNFYKGTETERSSLHKPALSGFRSDLSTELPFHRSVVSFYPFDSNPDHKHPQPLSTRGIDLTKVLFCVCRVLWCNCDWQSIALQMCNSAIVLSVFPAVLLYGSGVCDGSAWWWQDTAD